MGVESGRQIPSDKRWSVKDAESKGAEAVQEVTGCDKECIEEQLRKGHADQGVGPNDQIRPTTAGGEDAPEAEGTGVD